MSTLTYCLPEPRPAEITADRAARRAAERGSAELLRLLRLHHPGTNVTGAEDAHPATLQAGPRRSSAA
jgi:hypothetical protein